MLKTVSTPPRTSDNDGAKKRPISKRAHSTSPVGNIPRPRSPVVRKKPSTDRRCQSLSPSTLTSKKSLDPPMSRAISSFAPDALSSHNSSQHESPVINDFVEKEPSVPQCVVAKIMRTLATKKREFMKMRKSLVSQQNTMLESFAAVKELEVRAGIKSSDDAVGEVRLLSVSSWPAHDLLLLVRDDLGMPMNVEVSGMFGPQVLQQLHGQLNPIPEDVLNMGAELMARRIDLLNLLRGKYRSDRASYVTNMEWKTKNNEFDAETEQLHRMVAGTAENLKAKVNYSLDLAKVPWLDREALIKKIERQQKEILILQNKMEESIKNVSYDNKDSDQPNEGAPNCQTLCEELSKERSAREALKEVVSTAESMLRVARTRIATLERQLKETKAELESSKRKHKDLEQLVNRLAHEHSHATYRHRESSYDARSKKLLEVSKTGEITIEGLSRQRDALELRVKELREQAEEAERVAEAREMQQRSRVESLQAKVAEQEKHKKTTESREIELEAKVKDLEEKLHALRERSVRLVDMERRRCLEYVPSKESEPSDRETEIWKELQVTRVALSRAEEELRQSRADKDNFLSSLSRIAQGEGADSFKDKMATELLSREQKIAVLQHALEDQRENEKMMEQSMTQYENQLASLRLEVKRLRSYDCYAKEIPHQDLQTELLELNMQVQTLSRERTALVTAAASRALMLERHERAGDLFAKMTLARRELAASIDGRVEPTAMNEAAHAEVSRSLSSVCASAADTWTALRAERARVLRLESAVLAQRVQLERESRVRTQLERRRAIADRELLRLQHSSGIVSEPTSMTKNPSLIQDIFRYK